MAKSDYANHKLDYLIYDNSEKNNNPVLQKQLINGKLLFEVKVAYVKGEDAKMYLYFISFNNKFKLAKPSKFRINEIAILPDEGVFALSFNNSLAFINPTLKNIERTVDSRKWYNFNYSNTRIKFDKIHVINSKTVFLYPKMDAIQLINMMNMLLKLKKDKQDMGRLLRFTVSSLQDIEGNPLNIMIYTDYNQYREFFVKEVKLGSFNLKKPRFMDKTKPIFNNQRIVEPDNFDDYWMNTPLSKNLN